MAKERAIDLSSPLHQFAAIGARLPGHLGRGIQSHALIAGLPHQRMDRNRPLLENWLVTGERLVFDGNAKEFWLA